jgi:hypothetical protein
MTTPVASRFSGERVVSWLLFIVAGALAVLAARRPVARPFPRPDPLALAPPGARLVISVDVARLIKVARVELLRAGGDQLLGLRELCGFEPWLALERAVFVMPFRSDPNAGSDFALLARTSIENEPIWQCAQSVIRKRGGSPGFSKFRDFSIVSDTKRPTGEVALRFDGLFVLSGRPYSREVMSAAAGAAPSDEAAKLRGELHRKLRQKLGAAELTITLLPDAGLPMPGVQALGLGLQVGQEVRLHGLVYCVSPAACGDARALLESTKTELARDPQLSGLGGLRIASHPGYLELAARLPREQLAPLLTELVAP